MKIKPLLLIVTIYMIVLSACSSTDIKNQVTSTSTKNASTKTITGSGNYNSSVLSGNTNGNIYNGGFAVASKGWIYFSDLSNKCKLSKMKTDGDEKTVLNNDTPKYINISGDWIYYSNLNDNCRIYKVKTGGNERTKVSDEEVENLIFYNDCLYYLKPLAPFVYDLCRISVSGGDKNILANNVVEFNIYDDYIYYLNSNGLYRMKIDSNERSLVSKDSILRFIVQNKHIFYLSYVNKGKLGLFRMDIDGGSKLIIAEPDNAIFNVDDDQCYFIKDKNIIKVSNDGKKESKIISDIDPLSITLLDNWVYYSVEPSDGLLYKVKVDGSIANDANNGFWKDRFPLVVSASSYLVQGGTKYTPENLIDHNESTPWVEGSEGDGISEWVKFENTRVVNGKNVAMTEYVKGMYICNGYGKTEELYYSNNRVKEIRIEFSNGKSITAKLEDGDKFPQKIDFGEYIETDAIKITILGVYKGNKFDDTCISEISFYDTDWDGGCEGGT